MSDLAERLADVVEPGQSSSATPSARTTPTTRRSPSPAERPACVVRPGSTAEVAAVLRLANEPRVPVTARGTGTGLSGACVPGPTRSSCRSSA